MHDGNHASLIPELRNGKTNKMLVQAVHVRLCHLILCAKNLCVKNLSVKIFLASWFYTDDGFAKCVNRR